MIKDAGYFKEWETDQMRAHPADFAENLRLYEALFQEACSLGALPLKDPLEGLQEKINLAKALNVRKVA